jgi:hypothetical protein
MRSGGGVLFRSTVRPVFVVARDELIRLVERRYGIRTSGVVPLDELGVAAPDRLNYKPAPWFALRRALPRRSVTPDDVFLDFGSGMGRLVFQAALWYPFKRVIGVECPRGCTASPKATSSATGPGSVVSTSGWSVPTSSTTRYPGT